MANGATTATFTQRTVDLALDNVEVGGKPFACVVVDRDTGAVLHEATNQVSQTGDASAHAEIATIRDSRSARSPRPDGRT